MSGLAPLVLNTTETNMVDHHVKITLERIQKFHQNTPTPFVMFMSGCLPGLAVLHQRQLSLFGMICRLPDNILFKIAEERFSSASTNKGSWFAEIRKLCLKYRLPHPYDLLHLGYKKEAFKKMVKFHIMDFWEQKIREDSLGLPSLKYFDPRFMSLLNPHPIWSSAKNNPYEVSKAVIQMRMLSGRYRTEYLCRHWSKRSGACLANSCIGLDYPETIEHILLFCPSLSDARASSFNLWTATAEKYPYLAPIIKKAMSLQPAFRCQFVLDCSPLPDVIQLKQTHGHNALQKLLHLTRSYCFTLHRERAKQLGRWNAVFY